MKETKDMPILLAHSGGNWDEYIFLAVAIIFTLLMAIGWWRSRNTESDFDEEIEE